jgi:two-component system chemotaxis sensor kinase CheA
MDKSRDKALKDFVVEAEDILENLAEDLEAAQEQFEARGKVKPDRINKIFREMHSLKGLASMFNLERITTLSHDLESLLDRIRLGKSKASPALFSLLGESRSALRNLVAEAQGGGEETDIVPLLARISGGAAPAPEPAGVAFGGLMLDESTLKSLTEYEEHRLRENLAEDNRIYSVQVGFDFSDFDTRLRALTERLSDMGEVISTLPVMDAAQADGIHFRLLFGTTLSMEQVEAQVVDASGTVTDLLPPKAEKTAPSQTAEPETAEPQEPDTPEPDFEDFRGISNTVRVDIEKLDAVMGIVGELNLVKAAFEQLAGRVQAIEEHRELGADMTKQVRLMTRKLGDLQRSIIDIRLVPISQIFARLNRTARRLARNADKKVSVQLYGGETELDKMMMDELVTPLIHIIRNSIDHGLEPPGERLSAEKPEEGLLVITAYQKGNSIVIDVTDDGRGLQEDKIRQAAVRQGLVKKDATLTREDILDIIFQPGFTSAEKVTEVSGRGVGLDAVITAIQQMKGNISVWSEPGKGTTFQITVPITLAIIQSLIVECGDQIFAIPISSVMETFRTTLSDIQLVDQREVFNLRGMTLPLLRLDERFGLTKDRKGKRERIYVVVARRGEKAAGIVVDDLIGEQETVVHPLGQTFGHLAGVAGATEIGENQVILVIDTASLFTNLEAGRIQASH